MDISFLDEFLRQTKTTNLKTKHLYPDLINDLDVKVSFGMGTPTQIPWISTLGPGMSTSNGYYPVYLYYKKQNILILAFGISETFNYKEPWTKEIIDSKKKIKDFLDNPFRYGESYVFQTYTPEITEETVKYFRDEKEISKDEIAEDLTNIINSYKTCLGMELKQEDTVIYNSEEETSLSLDDLRDLYDDLLKDPDFDRLDLELKNPNIFQILRISNNEIRHSNFLSWLLDPNQSHKLGDVFLKRFLREIFSSNKFSEIDQVDVEGMDLSKVDIRREWENIDILIELEDVVVCIENKVLAKEHSNQLTRYKDIIQRNFPDKYKTFVFLSPDGSDSQNEIDSYEPISYDFIVDSLDRILSVYGDSINQQVTNYIKDYIIILKRELLGTDKLTELSNKIYRNHKDLMDFIFDHKPDLVDRLRKIMIDEVAKRGWILGSENKYYVRFLTPTIKPFIYYNQKKVGWNKGESFLFEIYLYPQSNKLNFKTVISPSEKPYNPQRFEEILLEIKGFRESKGNKWLVNKDKKQNFIYEDIPTMSDEEIEIIVNDFYDKITPIVKQVEEKLVENKKELQEMKNISV